MHLKITLSSPSRILSWSDGEVCKPETINYRTLKPEMGGLFCPKIFGPSRDFECFCGRYKNAKSMVGHICEKCGVEINYSKIRRERMGHITLNTPVVHSWFMKPTPGKISILLDIPQRGLESLVYHQQHIVLEPGLTDLKMHQFLTEQQLLQATTEYGQDSFVVGIGAQAIHSMLKNLDLEELVYRLRKNDSNSKRLILAQQFLESGQKPEWVVLTVLPVLPCDLRPLVPMEGGQFATSDLNDLYRRIINRNNRLKRLLEIRSPELVIRNERRMLQESVDALFDNIKCKTPFTNSSKRPLRSLADNLRGKTGRFRQNLLGKRVDYSGRSVIVVGPTLKLHQCGLPKMMALELFKPFIYGKLCQYGITATLKAAKKMVERQEPVVWDMLEEVIHQHPVMLNRAPTLHRLGIQGFEPVLVEGEAIQLHPLVCTAFNADFDGDQMAVHVPLSLESQLEVRTLMLSTNNILSPANGKPIIVPSQDMVLGIYYLSIMREGEPGEGKAFSSIGEIEQALFCKTITLHSKIYYRVPLKRNEKIVSERITTCAGRVFIWQTLPKHQEIDFSMVNRKLIKKDISQILEKVHLFCGSKAMVLAADQIKDLGFKYACLAGISFGKEDLIIPQEKKFLVSEAQIEVNRLQSDYNNGLISEQQKYNQVVATWMKCSDNVAKCMMKTMEEIIPGKPINSVYMLADSGARGSAAQIKQLAGMRGLMAKPTGEIIETPIIANFREGLSVLDYFTSAHGARKGLSDTALKTANSGYLTRRLVDVAHEVVVRIPDCKTNKNITVAALRQGGEVLVSLQDRLYGRVLSAAVNHPVTDTLLYEKGTIVTRKIANHIEDVGVISCKVRSVLTCIAPVGICACCYGVDLAHNTLVNVGSAVGVIAAQSIGEPGTQLTMRTFHIGGTAQSATEKSFIEAPVTCQVRLSCRYETNSLGQKIVMSRQGEMLLVDEFYKEIGKYTVPYGTVLHYDNWETATVGNKLAEWSAYSTPVLSEVSGKVKMVDLIPELSLQEQIDENSGLSQTKVIDWRTKKSSLKPQIQLVDDQDKPILHNGHPFVYLCQPQTLLHVKNGQTVSPGDCLAIIPKEITKTKDITGGLSRVIQILETRSLVKAQLAPFDGRIYFGKQTKSKYELRLETDYNGDKIFSIDSKVVPLVQDGMRVVKGEQLTEGDVVASDLLFYRGMSALNDYIITEIVKVYHLQGISISDKHIEIILRQMMRQATISEIGDSKYVVGQKVSRKDIIKTNKELYQKGKRLVKARVLVQGIANAALAVSNDSFISAASFQNTSQVLTNASIQGSIDTLEGLKECCILGVRIKAGTGLFDRNKVS